MSKPEVSQDVKNVLFKYLNDSQVLAKQARKVGNDNNTAWYEGCSHTVRSIMDDLGINYVTEQVTITRWVEGKS